MGTLRQDPTTHEWVIVAPERAGRPLGAPPERPLLRSHDPTCPFCPGNEHLTPPEILRTPGDASWHHRVVPNRYPALVAAGVPEGTGEQPPGEMAGVGFHEVVIESPLHDERLDDMPADRLVALLATWRDRYAALAREPAVRAVVVFKNFGVGAGTTLEHPHSQIMATPVVPPETLHRQAVAARYHDDTGRCVYGDLLERELRSGERVVAERHAFAAVVPFAGRLPYETWILPRHREPSFAWLRDDDLPDLADVLRDVVAALRIAAGDPDYNLVVHSSAVGEESKPSFRWHLRVLPRMTVAAGFELGSGMSINCVAPERAAGALRQALAHAPVR